MKKLFLSAIASIAFFSIYAQDSTSSMQSGMTNRRNAKKDRINNLLRMEEEGDLIFNKHNIFGIRLATDGYGISFEKGYYKTPTKTLIFSAELNEKKSPKEHRVSANPDDFSSIVLYKLNNFYEFKLAIGQERLIGGKGNKNGVAVTALYTGGLSLALLKPYFLNIDKVNPANGQDSMKRVTFDQYIYDPSNSANGYLLDNAAGFTVGWDDLTVKPGINARTAMRFDYGRLNQTVSAIEVGLTAEYYFGKIPQVLWVPYKQFFFNAYVSLLFGSRK